MWSRDYSTEDPGKVDCAQLIKALGSIPGAKRMIVGHTIQASSAFGRRGPRGGWPCGSQSN